MAGDGDDALSVAVELGDDLDVLVTDVRMPRANGYVVASAIRRRRPDVKVLYTSWYPPELLPAPALREHGTLYLAKPFEATALLAHVHRLLD